MQCTFIEIDADQIFADLNVIDKLKKDFALSRWYRISYSLGEVCSQVSSTAISRSYCCRASRIGTRP